MVQVKALRWFACSILFVMLLGCREDTVEPITYNPNLIVLKWNQSYVSEQMSNAVLGLNWCLSHIGASNTSEHVNGLSIQGEKIELNVALIGVDAHAQSKLRELHRAIQASEEYVQQGYVDLGRYITLLIGSSPHYYAITNAKSNLAEVLSHYTLSNQKGYVNNSSIASHHRIVEFSDLEAGKQIWLSTEVDSVTNAVLEYETIELMPNGQLKYAIYNTDSQLVNSPEHEVITAGKPAKCMWCHESNINPLFVPQNDYSGFMSAQTFHDTLVHYRNEIAHLQEQLIHGIDFTQRQAHAQMELQYIMFKMPSVRRLSNEWDLSEEHIETMFQDQMMFLNGEFQFLEASYHRNSIASQAPFSSLLTSTYVREKSELEVNYID